MGGGGGGGRYVLGQQDYSGLPVYVITPYAHFPSTC